MDPTDLSDDQLDQLATQIAPHLPTGTHGDRVVLSRRQFAAATAGVLSTGALMALGVDEASAQAAGQQGTESAPNDMFAYNLDVANQMTSSLPMAGNDIENAGSVSAEQISNTRRYAGGYNGSDPDARLDAALNAASSGDAIYLEAADYFDNYTISNEYQIIGTTGGRRGSSIEGTLTVDAPGVTIQSLGLRNESTLNEGEIILDAGEFSRCLIFNSILGSITINSGTQKNVIGFCRGTSITDNGSQNVIIGNL